MQLIDKEWHPITTFLSKKLANGERAEPGELLMRQHRPLLLGWHYRRPTWEERRDYERRHAISF